ncbi:hypothetical protein [Pedobacter frigiditerrae]|uniref:hypothetical protein n=1 Tax=Pedobacter frigiditerrae TaxID=2530452 RepID=UPI00292CBCB6|nr:hypothetical protein [Pedobacter frigiditerrae]
MLYIDRTLPQVVSARAEHLRFVKCRINKKLHHITCGNANCPVCTTTRNLNNQSQATLNLAAVLSIDDYLENIIDGEPDELFFWSNLLWESLVPGFNWGTTGYQEYLRINRIKLAERLQAEKDFHEPYDSARKAFLLAFEYDNWFGGDENDRYDAYKLALNLDRNTCTYCNRIYTHSTKGANKSKLMRPQYDHWFAQNKHPALALSFFNLIPSCSICNSSIKGKLDFTLGTHLHPYLDIDCQDKFIYSYKYNRSTKKYNVTIESTDLGEPKIQKTFEELKLRDVFDTHHSELGDLIKIKKAYSATYIKKMMSTFPKMHLSEKEVYRLAFGVEFEGKDFYKRPLSKFKKDILKELKIVK